MPSLTLTSPAIVLCINARGCLGVPRQEIRWRRRKRGYGELRADTRTPAGDAVPPSGGHHYPLTFSVDYPDRSLNRLSTAFRIFTIIPIAILAATIEGGSFGANSGGSGVRYAGGGIGILFIPAGPVVIGTLVMGDTVMLAANVIGRVIAAVPRLGNGGNGNCRSGHERQ